MSKNSATPIFHFDVREEETATTVINLTTTVAATHPIYIPKPVINLENLKALPPASRQRELVKEANTFLGNACHIFIHHVDPVLALRRKELLASGKTRKKFYKDARQLWQMEDRFFWNQAALQLRTNLKQGHLSAEQILTDAGAKDEWVQYLCQAEKDVSKYLGTEPPAWVTDEKVLVETVAGVEAVAVVPVEATQDIKAHEDENDGPSEASIKALAEHPDFQLLDTLPDDFEVDAKQVYGNFAQLWPYDIVREAEGKHQTALLRQLADLFDPSGRELFYYFAYPRLCKIIRPRPSTMDIAAGASTSWQFMKGQEKKAWEMATARTKKLLGDGNLEGLEMLQLDGKNGEVLRLHEMTEQAVKSWKGDFVVFSEK